MERETEREDTVPGPIKVEDGGSEGSSLGPAHFEVVSVRDPTQGPPVSGRPWKAKKSERFVFSSSHPLVVWLTCVV